MGDYTKQVKDILKAHGCTFVQYGTGTIHSFQP